MIKKIKGEYEIENNGLTYIFKDLEFDASEFEGFHLRGTFEIKGTNKKGKFELKGTKKKGEFEMSLGVDSGEKTYYEYEEGDGEDIMTVLDMLHTKLDPKTTFKQDGKDIIFQVRTHYKD